MSRLILLLPLLGIGLVYGGRICNTFYDNEPSGTETCDGYCYKITIRDKNNHKEILANKGGCDTERACMLPNPPKPLPSDDLLKYFGITLPRGAEGFARKECCEADHCNFKQAIYFRSPTNP